MPGRTHSGIGGRTIPESAINKPERTTVTETVTNILFVCTANRLRSPTA
jgi:hypothetical protein